MAGTVAWSVDEVSPSWGSREKWLAVVLAVALLAGAALLVLQLDDYRSTSALDDDRADAVAAAEHVAVGLVTLRPKSAAEDIEALAALGTGDFAKDLRANLESQAELFETNKISSTGEVTSAGLVSLKGDTASVAVAMKSTVKSEDAKKGTERFYRMTLTLQRSGDQWLVSGAEFVQ